MNRFLLALGCLALVACNSGPGPIVLTDTGPSGTDAPVMGTDAPVATDAPAGCAPMTAPAPTTAVCASSTLTCLMAATTAAAQQACITADPMATACNECILGNILSACTTSPAMCAPQYGNFVCCLTDACPTGDATCINTATAAGGMCATQVNDMNNCLNTEQMARRCGVSAVCFMAAAPLAPDFNLGFLRARIEADFVEHMSHDWTLAH